MSITHLLNQTCTIYTVGNVNTSGKYSYGSGTDVSCRFQKTSRVIAGKQDEQIPIDGVLFFDSDTTVGVNDKIVFGSDTYRVMRIEPVIDGQGNTRHYEVLIQDWST